MKRFAAALTVAGLAVAATAADAWRALEYAPAPPDNPLKGLVPYAGQARDFPHSLEFRYLPLRAVMQGMDRFDWTPVETLLGETSSRGCQAVFRFYLEYPGHECGIPQFLIDAGLRTHAYTNSNAQPPRSVVTPDYADPRLRAAMTNAIHAAGRRYDGDPRVAFLTAGFLGTWGEWHTHPRHDLWAPKETQREVMDAFEVAFRRTPVLLRYPAGDSDPKYAANHRRALGYHDDSFAWATLETGKKSDEWFFMARMRRAGPEAVEKWRTQPIGGEVRPENWPVLWNDPPGTPEGQDFLRCVEATHATWLMDSSIVRKLTPEQRARAIEGARRLGYELHVARAAVASASGGGLRVAVALQNRGVAPFYADWKIELAALDAAGTAVATWTPPWSVRGLQPDAAERVLDFTTASAIPPGAAVIAMRVVNPMPGGKPLRFANKAQDATAPGWLTLGPFPAR